MKFKLLRLIKLVLSGELKVHTGQYGEDIVLHKIFRNVPPTGFYVDVGAHHPFAISNTAYLWARGWRGVNVDASIQAVRRFEATRPQDVNVCAAVIATKSMAPNKKVTFYYNKTIDNNATCDPEIARARNLTKKAEVQCTTLKDIIKIASTRFGEQFDLLNIDIEGLDEEAIEDMAEWSCMPKVLMIKIYAEDIKELMMKPSVNVITSNGYELTQRNGHTAIFERLN